MLSTFRSCCSLQYMFPISPLIQSLLSLSLIFFSKPVWDDGLHVNFSACLLVGGPSKHWQGRRLRGGGEIALSLFFCFFFVSCNNIGNKWECSGVDKQNIRSRTRPLRVATPPPPTPNPFNSALQIFQREHRQSPAYKPLSVSLVDMSALWGGLRILHILNRSRIFIDWTKL